MGMALGNTEILQIADAVAREKGIQRDAVIEAMEQAIQVAARRKYGLEHTIRAEIDRKTGEIKLFRVIREGGEEITEEEANAPIDENDENVRLEPLPPIDLGRVAAQTAKQVIVQKVRDAERERQYLDFKDRVGEIVHGIVKKIEYNTVYVDLGRAEAVLTKDAVIKNEVFRQNDRVRAYVEAVRREQKGPQIFLSRSHPQFLAKLFAQEVPEVYDGIIDIKAVAREPGSRAKMAVYTKDSSLDPVGTCVGVRGARVQAVSTELQGEKVDIITWSHDPATFVVNALTPAEVSKVVIDEERHRFQVVVPNDQLSLAIGRRGQNVRLASQLTGWSIDVLTEEEDSKRRLEAFNRVTKYFMEALDVEEVLGQLLATEGFSTIDEIAFVPLEYLTSIEGFDEALAEELRRRAQNYVEQQRAAMVEKTKEWGMEEALASLPGMSVSILAALLVHSVKTLDDLADVTKEEFVQLVPDSPLTDDAIEGLILAARNALEQGEEE